MNAEARIDWSDGTGYAVHLSMTLDDAESASHQGQCDEDVRALSEDPEIATQLAAIDPTELRKALREYGAWDAAELSDHDQNLQRILWIAASDIAEDARSTCHTSTP